MRHAQVAPSHRWRRLSRQIIVVAIRGARRTESQHAVAEQLSPSAHWHHCHLREGCTGVVARYPRLYDASSARMWGLRWEQTL